MVTPPGPMNAVVDAKPLKVKMFERFVAKLHDVVTLIGPLAVAELGFGLYVKLMLAGVAVTLICSVTFMERLTVAVLLTSC